MPAEQPNPLLPIKHLLNRLKAACEPLGLDLQQMLVDPDHEIAQVIFTVDEERWRKANEKDEIDREFEQMVVQSNVEAVRSDADEAARKLAEGFDLDEEDT